MNKNPQNVPSAIVGFTNTTANNTAALIMNAVIIAKLGIKIFPTTADDFVVIAAI